jgi:hypothetical protein
MRPSGDPQLDMPALNVPTYTTRWPRVCKRSERLLAVKEGFYVRQMIGNFADNGEFHAIVRSFICRKYATWDRQIYFPSEGRRTEDYFPDTKQHNNRQHVNICNKKLEL